MRVQPCFAAFLCLPLCARLWIHAHAHMNTQAQTRHEREHKQKWFRCVWIRRMRCRRPFCVHVCETVVNSPLFVELNSTLTHSQRTHTKVDLSFYHTLSLFLSFVRTHTRPLGTDVCVRGACVCFDYTCLRFGAQHKLTKVQLHRMKKKRALYCRRFCMPLLLVLLPLLLLSLPLLCCQQHRAAVAAATSASAAASFLLLSIIWHCVIINCCRTAAQV